MSWADTIVKAKLPGVGNVDLPEGVFAAPGLYAVRGVWFGQVSMPSGIASDAKFGLIFGSRNADGGVTYSQQGDTLFVVPSSGIFKGYIQFPGLGGTYIDELAAGDFYLSPADLQNYNAPPGTAPVQDTVNGPWGDNIKVVDLPDGRRITLPPGTFKTPGVVAVPGFGSLYIPQIRYNRLDGLLALDGQFGLLYLPPDKLLMAPPSGMFWNDIVYPDIGNYTVNEAGAKENFITPKNLHDSNVRPGTVIPLAPDYDFPDAGPWGDNIKFVDLPGYGRVALPPGFLHAAGNYGLSMGVLSVPELGPSFGLMAGPAPIDPNGKFALLFLAPELLLVVPGLPSYKGQIKYPGYGGYSVDNTPTNKQGNIFISPKQLYEANISTYTAPPAFIPPPVVVTPPVIPPPVVIETPPVTIPPIVDENPFENPPVITPDPIVPVTPPPVNQTEPPVTPPPFMPPIEQPDPFDNTPIPQTPPVTPPVPVTPPPLVTATAPQKKSSGFWWLLVAAAAVAISSKDDK